MKALMAPISIVTLIGCASSAAIVLSAFAAS
jgi:hypothetical protein